jgi:7-carboxy-7-deazaguanine synthase
MKLNLNSMFVSIMGERGDHRVNQGDWALFLRLAGCNLNCKWCDTEYARSPEAGHPVEICDLSRDIDRELDSFPSRKRPILITGGEPLLQKEALKELFNFYFFYPFIVETNGSIDLDGAAFGNVSFVVDHKCPSSGELDKMKVTLMHLRTRDTMKFVIGNEDDYLYARSYIRSFKLEPCCSIAMSPVVSYEEGDGGLAHELCRWIQRDKLYAAGINLQLHKILQVD